ncbi:hypothetical protein XENTR_v10018882 [Xenopus tropicalis]|nr:hypothetical protein XENTR_v10018882 [Xenopus tropicalis]
MHCNPLCQWKSRLSAMHKSIGRAGFISSAAYQAELLIIRSILIKPICKNLMSGEVGAWQELIHWTVN